MEQKQDEEFARYKIEERTSTAVAFSFCCRSVPSIAVLLRLLSSVFVWTKELLALTKTATLRRQFMHTNNVCLHWSANETTPFHWLRCKSELPASHLAVPRSLCTRHAVCSDRDAVERMRGAEKRLTEELTAKEVPLPALRITPTVFPHAMCSSNARSSQCVTLCVG